MFSRFLIILLAVPILLYIFSANGILLFLFVEIISVIGLYEFYKMISKKYVVSKNTGLILGSILPASIYFRVYLQDFLNYIGIENNLSNNFQLGSFITVSFFIIGIKQLRSKKFENSLADITMTLFGIIYIPFMLSHILLINDLPSGNAIVLFSFLGIWVNDTGAYIVGMLFGKKIIKKGISIFSPKKSYEGLVGGIFSVFLLTTFYDKILIGLNNIGFNFHFNNHLFKIGNTKILILALIICFFANMGDLVESKFKRECDVKDSSHILLGHGGILDRFDSTIFVVPIIYYFMKYFIF